MIDAVATERHFIDHLAPVWRDLPEDVRGTFFISPDLRAHARMRGIAAIEIAAMGFALGDRVLTASWGDAKNATTMGYRRQAFLEHGIGQSYGGDAESREHGSYAGGVGREDTELFLVPNDHAAGRWRRAYPSASVVTVGCPKLATLPRRVPDGGTTIAVTFHFPAGVAPEARTAFPEYKYALRILARSYRLIGHAHPRYAAGIARDYRQIGIEFVPELEDVCRRADVLLFDNTSAGFEFASTGRPVVVMNSRNYRRNVNHGLRFWEASTVGPNVWPDDEPTITASRLASAIEQALELRPEDVAAREAALDLVYASRDFATIWAVDALTGWNSADVYRARPLAVA